MAEGGRRYRSGRRRRSALHHIRQQQQYDTRGASSDSELAQGEAGPDAAAAGSPPGRRRWFFHEGVDVDQLARYRRRRVQGQPRDHLGLSEDGTNDAGLGDEHGPRRRLDDHYDHDPQANPDAAPTKKEHLQGKPIPARLLTEYRLAFRASADDIFRDSTQDRLSPIRQVDEKIPKEVEENETSVTDSRASENKNESKKDLSMYKTQNELDFKKIMDLSTDAYKRPAPFRRGTTLRNEGDFFASTEYSNYVPFYGLHRSEMRRRGTSLRLEGDLETSTEKKEQFVEWPTESLRRPEPVRLPTNLKLEGELDIGTECRDKYVPFVGARRPDILKQPSQLRMEGNARWTPEYADVFKDYNGTDRAVPKKPEANLRAGGGGGYFADKTETRDFFTDPREKEAELEAKAAEEEEEERRRKEEEELERQREEEEELERSRAKAEEMRMLVTKLEGLKGPPLEVPEYKAAYKDFPRERPKLLRPGDEIGRADGSKIPSPCPVTRFRTKIDQDPEYKSIHLDPSKERWLFQRPPIPSARSSNPASGRNSLVRLPIEFPPQRRDSKRSVDSNPTTELRAQYVDYGVRPRQESVKMPPSLRIEGSTELEPSEYRTAYGALGQRASVAPSDKESLLRPIRERSLSASRRRDSGNYWLDNDNSERFGTVNAAEDQDAFQILQTRVHEDNVVGKPPAGLRRNSKTSQPRASLASLQPDLQAPGDERSPLQPQLRNRSPSPSSATYRLQVNNVDDEPRGFVPRQRRHSPILQNLNVHSSTDRSPSPIQKTVERPYSPSFAREESSRQPPPAGQHAFVVLDNGHVEEAPSRRRRTDRNFNPRDSLSSVRGSSNGNLPPSRPPRPRTPPNWMPPWYDSSTSTI